MNIFAYLASIKITVVSYTGILANSNGIFKNTVNVNLDILLNRQITADVCSRRISYQCSRLK